MKCVTHVLKIGLPRARFIFAPTDGTIMVSSVGAKRIESEVVKKETHQPVKQHFSSMDGNIKSPPV